MNEREQEAVLAQARLRLKALVLSIVGEGDLARFEEALTHPSFANESGAPDYQRLEFLGDAVLGLCVSEMLTQVHPNADEGALTRMRSALVNAEALARWAQATNLGEALALGKGARGGLERSRTNVLADAVEALVASVYVARGLGGARKLIERIVGEPMQNVVDLGTRDPKSLLQERVQAEGLPAPTYRVRAVHGPKHDPSFEIEVLVGTDVAGVGEGRSKRVAERAAALRALRVCSEQEQVPLATAEPAEPSEKS